MPRVRDRGVQRQIRGLRADASTMTPRGAKRKHCEAQELQEEHTARAPPTPSPARRRNAPVRRAPVASFSSMTQGRGGEVEIEEVIEELHEEEAASESFGEGHQSDHGSLSRTSGNTLGESIVRPERADGSSKSSRYAVMTVTVLKTVLKRKMADTRKYIGSSRRVLARVVVKGRVCKTLVGLP